MRQDLEGKGETAQELIQEKSVRIGFVYGAATDSLFSLSSSINLPVSLVPICKREVINGAYRSDGGINKVMHIPCSEHVKQMALCMSAACSCDQKSNRLEERKDEIERKWARKGSERNNMR